jgi:hypothetical protein
VLVRQSDQLCHYFRNNDEEWLQWEGPTCFGRNIRSAPALIQSRFGNHGDFEVVVQQGNQVCHYWRDNDQEEALWNPQFTECFGQNVTSAPALMQSNFDDRGNFEVVVRQDSQLCHFWRNNDGWDRMVVINEEGHQVQPAPWNSSLCFGEDAASAPALIQTRVATPKIYLRSHVNPNDQLMEISIKPFAFGYRVAEECKGVYRADDGSSYQPPSPDADPDNPIGAAPLAPPPGFPNACDTAKPQAVTIRNLVIEKYANPAQTGAIGYFRPGLHWMIERNTVRQNHGVGIKFKGEATVRSNDIHHNGQFGLATGDGEATRVDAGELEEWGFWGGYAGGYNGPWDGVLGGEDDGALVQGNWIHHNRIPTIGFNPNWGAGGTKFAQAYNLTVKGNLIEENDGNGLWTDFSYDGTRYQNNRVRLNAGIGVVHEISGTVDIVDNTVEKNAYEEERFYYQGQIVLSVPRHATVASNRVVTNSVNGHGVVVLQIAIDENDRLRGKDGKPCRHIAENRCLYSVSSAVYDNTNFHCTPNGLDGGVQAPKEYGDLFALDLSSGRPLIHFDGNVYFVSDREDKHWSWNNRSGENSITPESFEAFRQDGHEARGATVVRDLASVCGESP